ncbi:MAG: hypothetical protein AAFN10_09790 [Bacteroidota bacterium]
MKEQLEYFIRTSLKNPKDDEIKEILEIFRIKEFAKGDHFKKKDKVCNKLGFILEGSARHYLLKKNGTDITGRVSQRNNFLTDFISVRTKAVTPMGIEILEPSTLLVASVKNVEVLLETNLTFNRLIRDYMAEGLVEMGKMYLFFLTGTAKERYEFIIEKNPSLLKNIPLRFIASMIGITPTQLSRIRKKKD